MSAAQQSRDVLWELNIARLYCKSIPMPPSHQHFARRAVDRASRHIEEQNTLIENLKEKLAHAQANNATLDAPAPHDSRSAA
ncbi:MAG: hypothetical protein ABFD89_23755 [Bryobacteraceae bacterium]